MRRLGFYTFDTHGQPIFVPLIPDNQPRVPAVTIPALDF